MIMNNGSSNLSASSSSHILYSDRFIPSRLSSNLEEAFDLLEEASKDQQGNSISQTTPVHENQIILNNLIRTELLGQGQSLVDYTNTSRQTDILSSPGRKDSSLFKYRSLSNNSSDAQISSNLKGGEYPISATPGSPGGGSSINRTLSSPKKPTRKISKTPYKVLDAPALQDDYYLNLVDWSHNNVLSVALGPSVYLWSACTSKVGWLVNIHIKRVYTA